MAASGEAPWRVALRLTPPFGRVVSTGNLSLGGLAVAVTAPVGVFVEMSAQVLSGTEVPGYETSLGAGYVLHDRPRPHAWHLSLPVQLAWRHALRPAVTPSDGHSGEERLDMVAATVRPMATRTWQSNALELGLVASAGVPFSRQGPPAGSLGYYQESATKVWLDVGVFVGVSFGL